MSGVSQRPASRGAAPSPVGGAETPPTAANAVQVKILTIIVVVLGGLLLVGLATVVGRIIYLGSQRTPLASQSSTLPSMVSVAVPPGASVKHMAITGDRLAVSYEAREKTGIIVINVATGRIVSHIELVAEVPR